jgi:hypothetical protein
MALSSPGTQITIIDESQYLPAAPNSIPLVVIATAQNKINASGTGVAAATTKANAGKLYAVTSQRDLITYFGNPFFYKTTNGTPIQGYELNEYGLLAAYSTLGSTNLVYAIRADIDLSSLVGKTSRPTSAPDNGSWWLNTDKSTWGIYEFSATTGSFTNKSPIVITESSKLDTDGKTPMASLGNVGDYAVVLVTVDGKPSDYSTYYYKKLVRSETVGVQPTNKWVAVGDPLEWQDAWPIVQGTTGTAITSTTAGSLIISNNVNTASFYGTINNGSSVTTSGTRLTVTSIDSSTVDLKVGTLLSGTGIVDGTYITATNAEDNTLTGTGAEGTYTVSVANLIGTTVATVTGSISDGSGAAGQILTVTGTPTGTLTKGTLITGDSATVLDGAFVNNVTYRITSLGTTIFTDKSATNIATVVATGFTGKAGLTNNVVPSSSMVITAVTAGSGTLFTNQVISGTGISLGTTILAQTHNDISQTKTYVALGLVNSATLQLNNVSGLAIGQTIIAFDSTKAVKDTLFPSGTTITAIDTGNNTITLSNNFTTQPTAAPSPDQFDFYSTVSATNAANAGKGIYKISKSQDVTPTTVTGQPVVGTTFKYNGNNATTGTGTAVSTVSSGMYITETKADNATLTGTGGIGTYTVSLSQYHHSGTLVGTNSPGLLAGQDATSISLTASNAGSVASIKNVINNSNVSFLHAASYDNKVSLFITKANGSVRIGGTPATLATLGISGGLYNAPTVVYGTNAQQPLWRATDSSPHPTGSVWIKTNAINGGMNVVISQYNTSTGSYVNKTVTVAKRDADANNTLDSTGGKAIPLGSVYAKVAVDKTGQSSSVPVQLYTRTQVGASSWTGKVSSPTGFAPSSILWVKVSQPGTDAMLPSELGVYVVTMPSVGTGTSGTVTADDFVAAWTAANIPYTECSIDSVTGAIVLTHTEGGIIRLNDSPSRNASPAKVSPLVIAGFEHYDMAAQTGTPGARYGFYQTVNTAGMLGLDATYTGTGIGLKLDVSTLGYVPTITISSGHQGTLYSVNDIVAVTTPSGDTYQVKVTSVGGSGNVTAIEWNSGLATPEYSIDLSAWEPFDYIADTTEPVNSPANGTMWFHSVVNQIDIMTNVSGVWTGYQNALFDNSGLAYATGTSGTYASGPICAASEPTVRPDGNQLSYGDLWVDTGDLENFPVIYRWAQVSSLDQWVLIDNTDQTTEKGIVFADARWGSNGSIDPVNDTVPTIVSLLKSDYVDLDAPDATTYPQGTLLFNTRRSGYNVKKFTTNYFTSATYGDAGAYDATTPTDITNLPAYSYTWVSASGNKADGSPYMGRKAQRAMVVAAMKSVVDTSSELREEATSFNLIAAPGYPELQPNMVSLNNDRNETAYIIGDTPLRLENDANALTAWATNAKGATGTGEDGLVTRNTYLGIYYPSGITTDLTGSTVVVPASHMMLRTIIHNDTVAYPWFAPAGMRRGTIDNATNIGYIDAASGEFQTTKNRVALRDVQYTNFINPIAYFNNVGLLNYGNKNSYDSQSALDRTNVARLICYIRDRLQVAVRPFIFEPNDDMTRSQVKDVVSTLLADIKAKRGVYDYLVVCDSSNNTAARIDRSELWIDIAIEPVKAVEFIYIPVRIMNTGEIAGL